MFARSEPASASVYAMHAVIALRGGAEGEDSRRHQHRGGVDERRVVVRGFEAHDCLPAPRPAPAAVLRGEAHAEHPHGPGTREQGAFECLVPAREVAVVPVPVRARGRQLGTQEHLHVVAERLEFGGEVEVGERPGMIRIRAL